MFSFLICGSGFKKSRFVLADCRPAGNPTGRQPARRCLRRGSLFLAGGLLGEEDRLDVGEYTTLGDGDTGEKLVELLIVPHGELEVTGDDPGFLVVAGSVAGKLEDLSSQVLHDCSQVDWCTGTDSLGIVSLAEEPVDTSYGELESSTGRSGLWLGSGFASFTTARHVEVCRKTWCES